MDDTKNRKSLLKRPFKPHLLVILFLFPLNQLALANEMDFSLLLAGGALSSCSSMSLKNCVSEAHFDNAKTQTVYEISTSAHQRLKTTPVFMASAEDVKSKINAALEHIYASKEVLGISQSEFFALIEARLHSSFVSQLSDAMYYALLDTHEHLQLVNGYHRRKESASLAWTKNPHTREIFERFIARASEMNNGATPLILVVTASARDPFEAADFYESLFQSANAEAKWLPLSPAFSQALYLSELGLAGCEKLAQWREHHLLYDRERLYPDRVNEQLALCLEPEKLLTLLDAAHGIFFNGGDQSKTLASLLTPTSISSAFLQRLKQRVTEKKILVGGTSAGTAVQAGGLFNARSVPMLTNGDPEHALTQGVSFANTPSQRANDGTITLLGSGGTGIFHYGLLDTHFSERNRESRLIAATLFSQQRLGFGIDENTALLVTPIDQNNATFRVIGENGVFVVDLDHHEWQQNKRASPVNRQLAGMAHYWVSGSYINLTSKGWQAALAGKKMSEKKAGTVHAKSHWRTQVNLHCGTQRPVTWSFGEHTMVVKAAEQTMFSINAQGLCSYQSLPFVIANY